MVRDSYGGRLHEKLVRIVMRSGHVSLCGKTRSDFQRRFTTGFMMTELVPATMMGRPIRFIE